MPSIVEVEYWSNGAEETLPLNLILSPGGEVTLWLRCNRESPGAAIGLFRRPLEKAETDALLTTLESPAFAASTNPAGVVPGEVVRKVSFKQSDGSVTERFVGETAPPSSAFLAAEKQLLAFMPSVQAHPLRALSFKAEPIPATASPGQAITFTLAITNAGEERQRIPLPKAWKTSGTSASWLGLRNDVPLAQMGNEHSRTADLTAMHTPPGWTPPTPKDFVDLAPGQTVAFPLAVPMAWPPGHYDLRFLYASSLLDSDGLELTRFEWVSEKTTFVMKGE